MAKSVIKDIIIKKLANGKKTYNAVLEDGTTGYFNPKTDFEFVKGELVEYTVSEYTSKKNVTSNILDMTKVGEKPKPEKPSGALELSIPPLKTQKTIAEMKHEMRMAIVSALGQVAASGRIEMNEMAEWFNDLYSATDKSYDVIENPVPKE